MNDAIFLNPITLADGRQAIEREVYDASGTLLRKEYVPQPVLANPDDATPLNKANLLSSAMALVIDADDPPITPNDALGKLADKINADVWTKISNVNVTNNDELILYLSDDVGELLDGDIFMMRVTAQSPTTLLNGYIGQHGVANQGSCIFAGSGLYANDITVFFSIVPGIYPISTSGSSTTAALSFLPGVGVNTYPKFFYYGTATNMLPINRAALTLEFSRNITGNISVYKTSIKGWSL